MTITNTTHPRHSSAARRAAPYAGSFSANLTDVPLTATGDFDLLNVELMDRQATIEVGCVGHVSHGKSTIVRNLTGVSTARYAQEINRNMTIHLGYANAKLWQCPQCAALECDSDSDSDSDCDGNGNGNGKRYTLRLPASYISTGSSVSIRAPPMCELHGEPVARVLVRHFSFVDTPGHEMLMATMINGAASMDAAIAVIAANDKCPMMQTANHLNALELMQIDPTNVLVLQNKIDVVDQTRARQSYDEITRFLATTGIACDAPVLPVVAQRAINVEAIRHWLHRRVVVPQRNIHDAPRMLVVRSFDVNHPGSEIDQVVGGIAGGTLQCGVLRIGDEIEIRPGIIRSTPSPDAPSNSTYQCSPIRSRIVSLKSETQPLQLVVPGGLVAVGTLLDPALTKGDRLVGHTIGLPNHMPEIYSDIRLSYEMLPPSAVYLPPCSPCTTQHSHVSLNVLLKPKFAKNEQVLLNIGTYSTNAVVSSCYVSKTASKLTAVLRLLRPVCADIGARITISRRVYPRWRLVALGTLIEGNAMTV
jgi:translation initiation factor 2 subunit 3